MTTEAWFRAEQTNGTVLAWGEEKRPCKIMMNFGSPPSIAIQCYFADVEAKSPLALNQWYHVVHTYSEKGLTGVCQRSAGRGLDTTAQPAHDLAPVDRRVVQQLQVRRRRRRSADLQRGTHGGLGEIAV